MHIIQGWTNYPCSNLLSCSIPEIFFFQVVASWFGFFTWVERIYGSFVLCRLWWRAYTERYFIVIHDAIICWMDNIHYAKYWCHLFTYTVTKALKSNKEFRDDKMGTPEENDAFVERYMPRIFIAINKLCEFVIENKWVIIIFL